MRPSIRLFQAAQKAQQTVQSTRITFFTRNGCQLCVNAKNTLSNVWDQRPFVFKEINVMDPEWVHWRNLYEFDTPVVRLPPIELRDEGGGEGKMKELGMKRMGKK